MRLCRLLLGFLVLVCVASRAAGDVKAGEWVTVNKDGAEIKVGSRVMATLNKGQRLKLYCVFKEGGYALIYYTVGGKTCPGYISLRDVDAAPGTEEKAPPKNPFTVDDKVVVIAKEAKLKEGDNVVGTLPEGTPLVVKKVKDDWLGVTADIKGKPTFGWVHSRDVDYPLLKDKQKQPPKKEPSKGKDAEN
ncbi:MAG TPA: hypothetical protein VNE39_24400 [Planctomycetota bacterium]|nr:hypothetical protein [Planctomycetota bacterium]